MYKLKKKSSPGVCAAVDCVAWPDVHTESSPNDLNDSGWIISDYGVTVCEPTKFLLFFNVSNEYTIIIIIEKVMFSCPIRLNGVEKRQNASLITRLVR